jgi:hypothetical protein
MSKPRQLKSFGLGKVGRVDDLEITLEPGAFFTRWGWRVVISDRSSGSTYPRHRDLITSDHFTQSGARKAIPRTIKKLRKQQQRAEEHDRRKAEREARIVRL